MSNQTMTGRTPQRLTAEAAQALLVRLEEMRGKEKILVCSPGIAVRLMTKFEAKSLQELDRRLGVGVLPLAYVDDARVSLVNKKTIEDYFSPSLDDATCARLGLRRPGLWPGRL